MEPGAVLADDRISLTGDVPAVDFSRNHDDG